MTMTYSPITEHNKQDEFSLSWGTYVALTGFRSPRRIELLEASWLLFVATANTKFSTWPEAWAVFWQGGGK